MNRNIKIISKKYWLLLVDKEYYLWYCSGKIYCSKDINRNELHCLGILDESNKGIIEKVKDNVIKSMKILQRIVRYQPKSCIKVGDGKYCITFNKSVYIFDIDNGIEVKHHVRDGMKTPLNISLIDRIKGFDDCIAYGEYGWNESRSEINVVAYKSKKWETVYTFPKNTICHIHALVPDRNNNCIYILTGDKDKESGIWRASDEYNQVVPLYIGKQSYRTCQIFFIDYRLYYATDTPMQENHFYEIQVDGSIKSLGALPGAVINSTVIGSNTIFATDVEQNPNLPKILHYISSKKAQGNKDRFVHIYIFTKQHILKEIFRMKKDILPMWLFQFGNAYFPNNYRDEKLYIVPIAVKKFSFKTIEIMY